MLTVALIYHVLPLAPCLLHPFPTPQIRYVSSQIVLLQGDELKLWTFAYMQLLNKPYENEVTLRKQKHLFNAASLLTFSILLKMV